MEKKNDDSTIGYKLLAINYSNFKLNRHKKNYKRYKRIRRRAYIKVCSLYFNFNLKISIYIQIIFYLHSNNILFIFIFI